jgi:hypothetical protein
VKLRPEEITSILKERIEHYDVETDLAEVGTVLQVGDGIARIYGLENCVALEMLELEHGVVGSRSTSRRTTSAPRCSASGSTSRRASRSSAPDVSRASRRRGAARPRRRPARQPARRRRADRDDETRRSSSRRRASSRGSR